MVAVAALEANGDGLITCIEPYPAEYSCFWWKAMRILFQSLLQRLMSHPLEAGLCSRGESRVVHRRFRGSNHVRGSPHDNAEQQRR